jgi:hypothetical protein
LFRCERVEHAVVVHVDLLKDAEQVRAERGTDEPGALGHGGKSALVCVIPIKERYTGYPRNSTVRSGREPAHDNVPEIKARKDHGERECNQNRRDAEVLENARDVGSDPSSVNNDNLDFL